jgi:hypothetical protein
MRQRLKAPAAAYSPWNVPRRRGRSLSLSVISRAAGQLAGLSHAWPQDRHAPCSPSVFEMLA